MILVIDNYDSFAYNLVQRLGELGYYSLVYRNDKVTLAEIEAQNPSHIVISPGPCTPLEAGISNDVVLYFGGKIPILGVCLGHQCIGHVFNGIVSRALVPVHGKASLVYHDGQTIYRNIANPFVAGRYHSLVVRKEKFPSCLKITARTEEGEIMGIRHREYVVEGTQIHPESILTDVGYDLLSNFLRYKSPMWPEPDNNGSPPLAEGD
jgi:anthranilate synthase/aminodeoxychorismate synthase-like glutamine amidotransferase